MGIHKNFKLSSTKPIKEIDIEYLATSARRNAKLKLKEKKHTSSE